MLEGRNSPWLFFIATTEDRLGRRGQLPEGQMLAPESHHPVGEGRSTFEMGEEGGGKVQVPAPLRWLCPATDLEEGAPISTGVQQSSSYLALCRVVGGRALRGVKSDKEGGFVRSEGAFSGPFVGGP